MSRLGVRVQEVRGVRGVRAATRVHFVRAVSAKAEVRNAAREAAQAVAARTSRYSIFPTAVWTLRARLGACNLATLCIRHARSQTQLKRRRLPCDPWYPDAERNSVLRSGVGVAKPTETGV